MINRYFIEKIRENFPFELTGDQTNALEKIGRFLFSGDGQELFLLKGYAGTGKSSLIGGLVRTMNHFGQRAVLLAPTGRAAKVFSGYAAQQAFTIHKRFTVSRSSGRERPSSRCPTTCILIPYLSLMRPR